MLRKINIITLFLLFICRGYSQVKQLIIVDSTNKKPLINASIQILGKSGGYYSDQNGIVFLYAKNTDTLQISFTGYISRIFILKKNYDTVFLERFVNELPQVLVTKFKKQRRIGEFKTNGRCDNNFKYSFEAAKKIAINNKGNYKVEKICFPLFVEKHGIQDPLCTIRIYNVNASGFPGDTLLEKTVDLGTKNFRKKNFYFDVSDKNLILSDSLLFISFEAIYFGGKQRYKGEEYFKPQLKKPSVGLYGNLDDCFNKIPNIIFHRHYEFKDFTHWHSTMNSNEPFNDFAVGIIISE